MVSEKNHNLIIMRHAKSAWGTEYQRDFDRPLTERGESDADKMADWLAEQNLIPDIFISSPAIRAKQTALIMASRYGRGDKDIVWDKDVYNASLGKLLKVIEQQVNDHQCMILIGHNPGLDSLLCFLSADDPDRTLSGKLMTTSAIAILDYNNKPIDINPNTAGLHKLIRPKQLTNR